ncbi:MAG: tetratricopeptide repeat protein [Chromatiaceae bacterium]
MSFTRRLQIASEYFAGGRFASSERICRELWSEGFQSPELIALLGELLLLRNRPEQAASFIAQALEELGESPRLIALLADCQSRRGRLTEAASLYRQIGRNALSNKLEQLAPHGAYRFTSPAAVNLPLVEALVQGIKGLFILDTGVGAKSCRACCSPGSALRRIAGFASAGSRAMDSSTSGR